MGGPPVPLLGSRPKQHILAGLLAAIHDVSHLAQIDRARAEHADDHVADLFGGFQEGAGFHQHLAVGGGEAAGAELAVGLLQHRDDACRAETAGCQSNWIKDHAHRLAGAADEGGLGHQRHLFDGFLHLRGEPAQGEMVVAGAVKCEAEDRHVIDALGLDQRRAHSGWDAVEVRAQFLGEFHQAGLRVLTHFKAHDEQTLAVPRGGIDVFHTGQLP